MAKKKSSKSSKSNYKTVKKVVKKASKLPVPVLVALVVVVLVVAGVFIYLNKDKLFKQNTTRMNYVYASVSSSNTSSFNTK